MTTSPVNVIVGRAQVNLRVTPESVLALSIDRSPALQVGVVASGPQGASSDEVSRIASSALSAGRAVMIAAGGTVTYYEPVSANWGKFYGITMEAVASGAPVRIRTAGDATHAGWGLTPLAAYWAGPGGTITSAPPTTGMSSLIGFAVTADTLRIAPTDPVIIEE